MSCQRKEYLKKYTEDNKDRIKEYQAKYFQVNKEKLLQKRNQREQDTGYNNEYKQRRKECVCGKEYKLTYFYNHRKNCIVYKTQVSAKEEQQSELFNRFENETK